MVLKLRMSDEGWGGEEGAMKCLIARPDPQSVRSLS